MAQIRFLHDDTLVRRPGLSDADVKGIEADCDCGSITTDERTRLIYVAAHRGDTLEVADDAVAGFAKIGLAEPADDAAAALVPAAIMDKLRRAELHYRSVIGGVSTGDKRYDLKSPKIPLAGRKLRASKLELLRDVQKQQAEAAAELAKLAEQNKPEGDGTQNKSEGGEAVNEPQEPATSSDTVPANASAEPTTQTETTGRHRRGRS